MRNKKILWIALGSGLLVALTLVAAAVVTTTVASARVAREPFSDGLPAILTQNGAGGDDIMQRGRGGPGGVVGGERDNYLAEALGITVDELQAARQAAHNAALDEAVDQGLLTQAQADAIRTLGVFGAERGFGGGQMFGGFRGWNASIDMDALLAAELNISVDDLVAARGKAIELALADAVANGEITQVQADLIRARHALKAYIDPQALTAQVLGLSVDELQAARVAGTTQAQLLENAGLTVEEFRTALQAAYQAAVDQAVANGVITQEQADQLSSTRGFGMPGMGGPGMGGPGMGGPGMGGRGMGGHGMRGPGMRPFGQRGNPIQPQPVTPTPETPGTNG